MITLLRLTGPFLIAIVLVAAVQSYTAQPYVDQTYMDQRIHKLVADQQPEPDEPATPEGTAQRCDNYFNTAPELRCACGRAMHSDCSQGQPPVANDKKCKTYCRAQNCHCVNVCTS
jgi:hypothetical protein